MQPMADEWSTSDNRPSGVVVRFHVESMQDGEKTDDSGRPIFRDVEFIEKRVPGDKLNIVDRPVTEADKKEFARQYHAFKQNVADPTTGMPLKEWALLTKSQVETLNYCGVRTVEELVGLTEDNAKRIGAGVLGLQKKAQDYLDRAKGGATDVKLRAELERERSEKEALKNQVAELAAAVEDMQRERKAKK